MDRTLDLFLRWIEDQTTQTLEQILAATHDELRDRQKTAALREATNEAMKRKLAQGKV